jgi:hypothetical protein
MMNARFYQELSEWWPLFSPPEHYAEEADDLLRRLAPLPPPGATTVPRTRRMAVACAISNGNGIRTTTCGRSTARRIRGAQTVRGVAVLRDIIRS